MGSEPIILKNNPAPARSRAERAYLRLRSEILHGELMPGERLRATELHDRYRLGLTPIREALMRLSSEGLVAAETHRGPRVMEVSREQLADLMETRRDVERLCLARAIERGDATWEADIVAAMHMLSCTPLPATSDDRAAAALWETRHRHFHSALVAACGSEWMLRFWNTLADHSERYRKVRLLHHREAQARVRDINGEHAAIMEAVLRRDVARAVALMDAHLAATEQAVMALLAPDAAAREQE
jgi:GntR family carbon starvation induced transcriptional regulator